MKISTYPLGQMQTNCYFLVNEANGECAIVDPADDCHTILRRLNERKLHLQYILLTHAHFDHMLALEELRSVTGAPVGVHAEDAPALLNPKLSMMAQFANIHTPCRPAEILLFEGDALSLGEETIQVMHTPGHTLGSVCYLTDTAMLSGDTLFRGNIGRYDFYGGSFSTLQLSLQRIAALPYNYRVFPGHGASSWLDTERKTNPYMQS